MSRRVPRAPRVLLAVAATLVAVIAVVAIALRPSGGDGSTAQAIAHRLPKVPRAVDMDTVPAAPVSNGRNANIDNIRAYNVSAGDKQARLTNESLKTRPDQFDQPIATYRRYATRQATALRPEVATLTRAIDAGDRGAAQRAWKVAFAQYLKLGGVYGAFGPIDDAIEVLPGGLPKGDQDPHFGGLHRIEQGLWTGGSLAALRPVAAKLQRDVARLPHTIQTVDVDPLDYSLRAHEILEDAQRDFLSGTSVPWSHEGVLATESGVTATAVVVSSLTPLLNAGTTEQGAVLGLTRLSRTIAAIRKAHGGTDPSLPELTRSERQQLVGSIGWALERLQLLPGSLELPGGNVIPPIRTTP